MSDNNYIYTAILTAASAERDGTVEEVATIRVTDQGKIWIFFPSVKSKTEVKSVNTLRAMLIVVYSNLYGSRHVIWTDTDDRLIASEWFVGDKFDLLDTVYSAIERLVKVAWRAAEQATQQAKQAGGNND